MADARHDEEVRDRDRDQDGDRERKPGPRAGEGGDSKRITASRSEPEPDHAPESEPEPELAPRSVPLPERLKEHEAPPTTESERVVEQRVERLPEKEPEQQHERLPAQLVAIDPEVSVQRETAGGRRFQRTVTDRHERTIRSTPPVYRWVCPCQNPPVLLATYGPNARINIKVRDRYWHLQGFGMVEAICPRCAAEHMLDMRLLRHALGDSERASSIEHDDPATAD